MKANSPEIDLRNQTELADQLRDLLAFYCSEYWEDSAKIKSDKWTESFLQVYARLMEIVIQHINRAPDKNFLAFLDTMGIGLLPPRPAKTALVFSLAKKAPRYVKVPAGTQVGASASPDEKPVIFETYSDIDIIQPRLVRVMSLVPAEDKWRDHSAALLDEKNPGVETLFTGTDLVRRRIYFGGNELFAFADNKKVILTVKPAGVVPVGNPSLPKVKWYGFTEDADEPLELTGVTSGDGAEIVFENVPPLAEKELTGFADYAGQVLSRTNRWIFAELVVPVTESGASQIQTVQGRVDDSEANTKYQADLAFFNKYPVDLSKDFSPFGGRPKYNDTFYLASEEIFAKAGATVCIGISLTQCGVPSVGTVVALNWEYWDGRTWRQIDGLNDPTSALTTPDIKQEGLTFECPEIVPCKVNGKQNYWIRARIIGGDYGKEAEYEGKDVTIGEQTIQVWSLVAEESYVPPVIATLELSCQPVAENITDILTLNDCIYRDESGNTGKLIPFRQSENDKSDAIYLAFDGNLATLPITLFFPLLTEVSTASAAAGDTSPPRLQWEYWNGKKWLALATEDETRELTGRGMIRLLVPEDCRQSARFGEDYSWIRARLDSNSSYPDQPRLSGLYTNGVWAKNMVTVKEELLGSSNGSPSQALKFSNSPVLPGQEIFIREAELTAEERAMIEAEEGSSAFQEVGASRSNSSEIWVRWHQVDHFWFSGPHSRHYTIDRQTGVITFGNGKRGMIPQAGRNNIVARPYLYGGGIRGNLNENLLTKMRKAIPYIDSVSNPVASEGGADVETLTQVRTRGPRAIRHRNKAVTLTDYEWIVQEASPKIARVKGLSVMNPQKQFKPGWVTMMVVPYSKEAKPLPTSELIDEVVAYLARKAPSCLTDQVPLQQINLIPPNYLRVDVSATVAVRSISDVKEVENLISRRLEEFFHALVGGPTRLGWEFGRNVYKTEIYEVLEGIGKVDYVQDITIKAAEQIYEITAVDPLFSATSFPDHSRVHFRSGKITLSLSEALPKEEGFTSVRVFGFMEGDHIELRYVDTTGKPNTLRLYVTDVDGQLISCKSVKAENDFPVDKTTVETYLKPNDLKIRSYLVEPITQNGEFSAIKIAVPAVTDDFTVSHRDWRSNVIAGKVKEVDDTVGTVFLEKDSLVYSGNHKVTVVKSGEPYPEAGQQTSSGNPPPSSDAGGNSGAKLSVFLVNTASCEVHDLSNVQGACNIAKIQKHHLKYVSTLEEIKDELKKGVFDYCGHCFGPGLSKR